MNLCSFIFVKYTVDSLPIRVYSLGMKYKICEANLKTLTEKLSRLSAKLVRIGAAPVTYKVVSQTDEPSPEAEAKLIRYFELEVEGVAPKHNGWEFQATLVHTEEGNIIRSVPGFVAPADFRDKAPLCDHCHTHRVRRDTYVVRHEDGRTMQVGSSCLQDFLTTAPGRLTKAAEYLFNAYDICDAATKRGWLGGSNVLSTYRIDLDTYLKNVAAVVLKEGRYITRKIAREGGDAATSDTAMNVMQRHEVYDYPTTPEAQKLATEARAWVLCKYSPAILEPEGMDDAALKTMIMDSFTAPNASLSDFEHNLLSCARAEAIEPRLCGIAAYIIEAYRRSQPKPEATQLNVNGLSRIFAMFDKAKAALKRPAIRLANEAGQRLHLSLAGAASKNAGFVYVKSDSGFDSPYYGKISPDGRFFGSNACPPSVEPLLQSFANDPEGIATKYGRLTGCCSFCGRKLTDKRSTEMGYGPVCADKFGLDWGKKITGTIPVLAVPQEQAA